MLTNRVTALNKMHTLHVSYMRMAIRYKGMAAMTNNKKSGVLPATLISLVNGKHATELKLRKGVRHAN